MSLVQIAKLESARAAVHTYRGAYARSKDVEKNSICMFYLDDLWIEQHCDPVEEFCFEFSNPHQHDVQIFGFV